MSNFVVGERLGEGSFGVVYAGAVVPKNVTIEERVGKRRTRLEFDDRFKERVILKKVMPSWSSFRCQLPSYSIENPLALGHDGVPYVSFLVPLFALGFLLC